MTQNVKEVKLDPLSYCSLPIRLINVETHAVLSIATAFLYKNEEKYYLITNHHNVTGVDSNIQKRISSSLASPTGIEIPFLKQKTPHILWERRVLPLYNSDNMPLWYIHPIYHKKVDVIAFPIDIDITEFYLRAINEIEFENEKPMITDTVFILGFPNNISSGANFPIWKRGSIASEPDIDLDGLPKMLVDTASRVGMSGSPVVYRRQGIHGLVDGKLVDESIIGEIQSLCGIYSGRIRTDSELDTQLGIVWKKSVIQEIIAGKQREELYYPHETFG